MMTCHQLLYFDYEISEFKDRRCLWDVWGKTRNSYRVLLVETEGNGTLGIVQCSLEVKVKYSSPYNLS